MLKSKYLLKLVESLANEIFEIPINNIKEKNEIKIIAYLK